MTEKNNSTSMKVILTSISVMVKCLWYKSLCNIALSKNGVDIIANRVLSSSHTTELTQKLIDNLVIRDNNFVLIRSVVNLVLVFSLRLAVLNGFSPGQMQRHGGYARFIRNGDWLECLTMIRAIPSHITKPTPNR